MPNGVNKRDLPTKICAACGRPFTWRKKWERDWEQVRFCSDGCRRTGARPGADPAPAATGRGRPPQRT